MSNDRTQHTPADVRELAVEIIRSLDLIARNYDSYEYGLPVMTHYDEMVDTVVALLRTPRGEGERVKGAWATVEAAALAQANMLDSHYGGQPAKAAEIRNAVQQVAALLRTPRSEGEAREEPVYMTCMGCGQEFDPDDDTQSRYHEAACEVVDYEPARVEIARRLRDAALRSDAQEKEDAPVCASCGEPIGDEPTVIWQDAYTHYRCTPEDAIRDDTPVIRPIERARRALAADTEVSNGA